MLFAIFAQILTLLLDLFTTTYRSDRQKDLQILLLRRQLRILQRKHPMSPRISRWEKCSLAVLTARLKQLSTLPTVDAARQTLDEVILLFKPDTPWRCREPWCSNGIGSWCVASGHSKENHW